MRDRRRAAALCALVAVSGARAEAPLPAVVVTAPGSRPALAELGRSTSQPEVLQAVDEGAARLEDLAPQVPGMQPQVTDGGLTGAVNLRGWAVSRFYINGLRDVNRLFTRDLATVASVQVLRGPDTLASGFNSPGGSVWFEGLQPEWQARQRLTLGAGSGDGWRAGIDSTGPLGAAADTPLAYRALLQWQDGRSQPGRLPLERHTALLALSWRDARAGLLTLEAEHQHNHQPFLFGTVVLDGRVRHDQLYASTDQVAQRSTRRQGLHWQQDWQLPDGGRLQLRADLGAAQVRRDETLIGFFTIRTPDALSGYYTRYRDDYLQHDARLAARWQARFGGVDHALGWTWTRSAQRFVFEGVQNIGGFDVSVQAPDFGSVDPQALRLTPRYRRERAGEQGWMLHDRLALPGGWALQLGVSGLRHRVEADRTGAGLRTAGQVDGRTWQAAVARTTASGLVPYLAYNQGLEPNRGTTRQGDWLPPQRAVQWEAGLRRPPDAAAPVPAPTGSPFPSDLPAWQVAVYRITQDNLPTTDPLDRTALVSTGLRRVQGLEASGRLVMRGWQWQAQGHLQQTANLRKTAGGQGDAFPGVASRGAAVHAEGPLPGADGRLRFWLQWQASGPRWADVENSVRLHGHALASVGLRWQRGDLRVQGAVHNLFDRDHVATVTALDNVYQGTPRRLWLSLAYRL
jgi:iron complex outermembrane receptor protein